MLQLPAVPIAGGFLHVSNHVANGERPFLEPDEVESFVERVLAARERDCPSTSGWPWPASGHRRTGRVQVKVSRVREPESRHGGAARGGGDSRAGGRGARYGRIS